MPSEEIDLEIPNDPQTEAVEVNFKLKIYKTKTKNSKLFENEEDQRLISVRFSFVHLSLI